LYVWTYLAWHNFLLFFRKIFEEVFCAAQKRILLIAITPTIKVQILRSLASWNALLISYLRNFYKKISIHHHLKPSCPKQQWPKFGHYGLLGVNSLLTIKIPKTHITSSSSYSNMPKTAMTEIQSLLGFRG
jgi:hypothetical protein